MKLTAFVHPYLHTFHVHFFYNMYINIKYKHFNLYSSRRWNTFVQYRESTKNHLIEMNPFCIVLHPHRVERAMIGSHYTSQTLASQSVACSNILLLLQRKIEPQLIIWLFWYVWCQVLSTFRIKSMLLLGTMFGESEIDTCWAFV